MSGGGYIGVQEVAVFPVIFMGELPNKTMFASLVVDDEDRDVVVVLGRDHRREDVGN